MWTKYFQLLKNMISGVFDGLVNRRTGTYYHYWCPLLKNQEYRKSCFDTTLRVNQSKHMDNPSSGTRQKSKIPEIAFSGTAKYSVQSRTSNSFQKKSQKISSEFFSQISSFYQYFLSILQVIGKSFKISKCKGNTSKMTKIFTLYFLTFFQKVIFLFSHMKTLCNVSELETSAHAKVQNISQMDYGIEFPLN